MLHLLSALGRFLQELMCQNYRKNGVPNSLLLTSKHAIPHQSIEEDDEKKKHPRDGTGQRRNRCALLLGGHIRLLLFFIEKDTSTPFIFERYLYEYSFYF